MIPPRCYAQGMSSQPRRPWHSCRLSTVLYWILVLLLMVAAGDILNALVYALR
jgi:hypothetical protein